MIENIRHTGIVVDDLEKSLYFYIEYLGFKVAQKLIERGSFIDQVLGFKNLDLTTVKLVLPNSQMIELLDFKSHKNENLSQTINEIGPTHLAFTVENIDKLYHLLLSNNIRFISEPKVASDGCAKVAFCQAPEGTYIELVEIVK